MRRVAKLELGGVLKRCFSGGVFLPERITPSLSYTAAFPLASSFKKEEEEKEEEEEEEDLHQFSTPDVLSGGPPSWGLEHRGLCFGCDLFINLQPHDLGRRIREKLLGLPLCRYDTGVSSPLVAAGIEWFHPLLGRCVHSTDSLRNNGRNLPPERPQGGSKPGPRKRKIRPCTN